MPGSSLGHALRAVGRAYEWLITTLAVLAAVVIGVAFVLVIVDVALRVFGQQPPAYTSAVVEYILLYFTLLAAPYLVRQKSHVHIDAVIALLHGGLRVAVEKLVYVICISISLLFAYISGELAFESIESGLFEERSIDIPLWLLYAPMPVCFALVAVEFGRYLLGVDSLYGDRREAKDSV